MKRGIVMSFSMIAVLASILFIAVSLRQISDTYQSSDNSALDHAAFVKSTMTSHYLWITDYKQQIEDIYYNHDDVSSLGRYNQLPILFNGKIGQLKEYTGNLQLPPVISTFCENNKVTGSNLKCESVGTKIMFNDDKKSGEVVYSYKGTNKIELPFDFSLDSGVIDTLNNDLVSAHNSCNNMYGYYECFSNYVDVCGHSKNNLCLKVGGIEINFYVFEEYLPMAVKLDQDIILVRNPDETFTITEFNDPVQVSPSTVAASSTYSNKIIVQTSYNVVDLSCDTAIPYCNGVLSIPKTRDHVYLSFPNEDKYYTFSQ